jgi:hypothetical protein
LNFSSTAKPDIQFLTANRGGLPDAVCWHDLYLSDFSRAGMCFAAPNNSSFTLFGVRWLSALLTGVLHEVGSEVLAISLSDSVGRLIGGSIRAGARSGGANRAIAAANRRCEGLGR